MQRKSIIFPRPSLFHSRALLGLLFCCTVFFSRAQEEPASRFRWHSDSSARVQRLLLPGTQQLALDSLPIVQESLSFRKMNGDTALVGFRLKGSKPAQLLLEKPLRDSLWLHYRRLPFMLQKRFYHKDSSLLLPSSRLAGKRQSSEALYTTGGEEFVPFAALNSQGAISRSIAVGNNQDAVLNSALNLQLSGNIGENTQLRASISDNTLPVQADGSTQQLREFDRVYLELENPDFGRLRAGDYDMASPDSYFLRFQKRISGAGVFTEVPLAKNQKMPVEVQAGLARGKFARNRFQGQEGNQGPYKLSGAEGEQFIIIISGSERVYIDGRLLKRGEQYDYTIDYNAGEISFTALQPITRDKRIVIEFQYTQQNYLRSVVYGRTGLQSENWQTEIQYFNEQDSKNQPLTLDLSDEEKAVLESAGDNLDQAVVNTIRPAVFDASLPQYRLIDSLGFDSVLVYTTDSNALLHNASFSFVGSGRGHYRQGSAGPNGRVFEWVAPVNGQPQGSYAPLRRLIAPNRLQVLTASTRGNIGDHQQLAVDLASSQRDVNLFSDRDAGDNNGLAGKLNYAYAQEVGKGELAFEGNFEFNSDNFATLERVRPVEFARDWNLPLNYDGAVQLAQVGAHYRSDSLRGGYRFEWLQSALNQGQRHSLSTSGLRAKDIWNWNFSVTLSEDSLRRSRFWRESGAYRHYFAPKLWAGVESVGEWNLQATLPGDSLFSNSYSFIEYSAFAGWGDTSENFVELGYLQRFDDSARMGSLQNFTAARTYYGRSNWKTSFNSRVQLAVYYRQLQILQDQAAPQQQTLTSRLSYSQRLWKNAVVSTSFYESGAGSEPRRSFTYVEVPPGTGTHMHTDYNGNGRRELDEFEVAPSPELGNFVRVFSPNVEFVRTNIVKLGQNLNLNAPQSWQRRKGGYKFLSRFSSVLAFQLDRRTLLEQGVNQLNPFAEVANDTLIVALNNSFRQTLFFNRSRTSFGGDYTFRTGDNRNLVTQGIEQRSVRENILNLRYGIGDYLILRWRGSFSEKQNRSGNFINRNFDLGGSSTRLALSYQTSQKFSLTGSYTLDEQESIGEEINRLLAQTAALEMNYNLAEKIALQVDARYIFNDFEGSVNNPAGFEMLQALRPGRNATLTIGLQRSFLKNIVVSLNYAGRFSSDVFAVHNGNLQVKAFF